MRAVKYNKSYESMWNEFNDHSKNGTFLLNRNFMDYHSKKYDDFSCLIFNSKNRLVAVFPANINKNAVFSHQGLTYGGVVLKKGIKIVAVLKIFHCLTKFYNQNGVDTIFYKSVPKFYHKEPSNDEEYALFLLNSFNYRTDTTFVIINTAPYVLQKRRKRMINKGLKHSVKIEKSNDYNLFWRKILVPNLKKKYNVKPVHSEKEILLLKKKFPSNIHLYVAFLENNIVAGTVLFETKTSIHAQYISSSDLGKRSGAIDLLFDSLINNSFKNKNYFSLGISNEKAGKKLNIGLTDWKEGFGCHIFSNKFYKIDTKNFYFLNTF